MIKLLKKAFRLVKELSIGFNFFITIGFWVATLSGEYTITALLAPCYIFGTYWLYERHKEQEKFWKRFEENK